MLQALGTRAEIRARARDVGFEDADLDEGWRLLRAACDRVDPNQPSPLLVRHAFEQLTSWSRGPRRVLFAVARRVDPALGAALSSNTKDVVASTEQLLDRLEQLARDHGDSHPLLARIAERRLLEPDERRRLRAHIATARTPAADDDDGEKQLMALHAWNVRWSDALRAAITSRAQLIALGLARRQ